MEVCLLLYDSSNTCSSRTCALTSHLHFPLNPHSSRTQTAEESQELSPHAPLFSPQPPANSHPNTIPNRNLDIENPSDPKSTKRHQPSNVKPVHQGPKIFDKVRAFETRMASSEKPGGSVGSRVSFQDSSDNGKKNGGPSREEVRILQGAAQKRATFKQRASSLEDKTNYSQIVENYQSKFTEELQRIKKLVGKPSLKKAYSTEQLSQKGRLATEKVEPIPPQVVQKLEARERAMREREPGKREGKSQMSLEVKGQKHRDIWENPVDSSSQGSTEHSPVAMETAPVHPLPGQTLPTAIRTSLSRYVNMCGFFCLFNLYSTRRKNVFNYLAMPLCKI